MKWYTAKLVFHIIVGTGDDCVEFDEQLILIAAVSRQMAYRQAKYAGINKQDRFLNIQQQEVLWKFIDVAEVNELNEQLDGSELHSEIKTHRQAEQYINSIRAKATQISNFNNQDWVQLL
jgi:hypothetical protein